MDKPTDHICMICRERQGIFSFSQCSCGIDCGHTFHSVCHGCQIRLVREVLDKLPIERHLAWDYLPEKENGNGPCM